MSSQPGQTVGAETWALPCTFCDCPLTESLLALQGYPSSTTSVPGGIPDDGGLTLCPDCASEVVDLVTTWRPHGRPAVGKAGAIGDGYREVASNCSFCGDGCQEAVLGIELYRRVGEELPAYANYTLCGSCRSVFGEFLQNVRS